MIGSHPLWTWDGLVFQADILLGSEYGVGTFTAEAVLTTGLGWDQTIRQFDVVAGGDSGSSVVSIHAAELAYGRFTLVQLASGRLVMGREPYTDGG